VGDRDHTVSLTSPTGSPVGATRPGVTITVDRVSLVAAVVCPHPPLLVPEVGVGAAWQLDELRAAADSAVHRLLAARPDRLIVVGGGPQTFIAVKLEHGSWGRYGMPDESSSVQSPLSLLVGAWLLDRVGIANPTSIDMSGLAVADDIDATACAAHGAELARTAERVAFLVMGDGSACRGPKAPGYHDPRAEPYDKAVAEALATADAEALLALDETLSAQLLVAGRAPWQVLAGAALASGRGWRGELHYDEAPYGVAYFVARWDAA
jgi:hypothetical protein